MNCIVLIHVVYIFWLCYWCGLIFKWCCIEFEWFAIHLIGCVLFFIDFHNCLLICNDFDWLCVCVNHWNVFCKRSRRLCCWCFTFIAWEKAVFMLMDPDTYSVRESIRQKPPCTFWLHIFIQAEKASFMRADLWDLYRQRKCPSRRWILTCFLLTEKATGMSNNIASCSFGEHAFMFLDLGIYVVRGSALYLFKSCTRHFKLQLET